MELIKAQFGTPDDLPSGCNGHCLLCPIKALFYTLVNDYSLTTDRFKGEKTCSNDVVRLVIELIGRYCSDYKQTTNRNLKISGAKSCVLPTDCIFLYKYQCHVADAKMQFVLV